MTAVLNRKLGYAFRFAEAFFDAPAAGFLAAGFADFFAAVIFALFRCTAPGIPDTYQGTEVWDDSMVDPDNRRTVDYPSRAAWLSDALGAGTPRLDDLSDPRVKLFSTARALRWRRDHARLFAKGGYTPIAAEGEFANNVFCFLRTHESAAALIIVPRLTVGLGATSDRSPLGRDVWRDTQISLPEAMANGTWTNIFTGAASAFTSPAPFVGDLLESFPVAVWVQHSNPAQEAVIAEDRN